MVRNIITMEIIKPIHGARSLEWIEHKSRGEDDPLINRMLRENGNMNIMAD